MRPTRQDRTLSVEAREGFSLRLIQAVGAARSPLRSARTHYCIRRQERRAEAAGDDPSSPACVDSGNDLDDSAVAG
jgi:hypothetical protein